MDVLGCLWAGMVVQMGFGLGLDTLGPLGCVGGSDLLLVESVRFHNFHDFQDDLLILESDYLDQDSAVAVDGDFHAPRGCVGSVKSFQLKFQIRS